MSLINVGYNPVRLQDGDSDNPTPFLVVNRDLINPLYIGTDASVAGANQNVIGIIDALSSMAFTGDDDIWATTGSVSVTVLANVQQNASSWSASPAQAAAQIAALGLATETTQQANHVALGNVNSTLGTPAQTTDITQMKTALGTPAQTSDITSVRTTLGTPAQTSDINGVKTTLGTPAQTSDVNGVKTTLGTPAQTNDVITTLPTNISTTGVPLLTKTTSVVSVGSTTNIPASGGTATTGNVAVTQLSYEITVALQVPSITVSPFIKVTLIWSDTANANKTIDSDIWYLAAGSASDQVYVGTGPSKGDRVNITFTNESNGACTMSYLYMGLNSRVLLKDDWRQITNVTVPGYTNGVYQPPAGVLLSTAPVVNANTNQTRLVMLYAGLVQACWVPAAAAGGHFTINTDGVFSDLGFTLPARTIYQSPSSAVIPSNPMIYLPRGVCTVTIFNDHATINGTFSLSISVAEGYPQ